MQKIKKYWFLIFLAFLATILSFIWFTAKEIQPEPPKVVLEQPNLPGVATNPQTSFVFESEVIQQDLVLFKATKLQPYTEQEVLSLASSLGFDGNPQSANDIEDGIVYFWNQEAKSLSITPKTREVRYHLDLITSPLPEEGDFLSEDQLKTSATDLLEKLGVNSNNTKIKTRYLFLDGPDPIESSQDAASLFEITFSYNIQNKELMLPRGEPYVARFWIDKTGNLARLDMQNLIATYVQIGNYPSKNKNEILQNLSREGKLFSTGEHSDLEPQEIQHATIQSVDLIYFLDLNQDVLQPLYILRGTGVKTNGDTVKPSFYLPAISNSFYKN